MRKPFDFQKCTGFVATESAFGSPNESMCDRRAFLRSTGALGVFSALHGCAPKERATRPSIGEIGLQLYTVRELMEQDPVGTLQAIAKIGYTRIELFAAGYSGMRALEFRSLIDELRLSAPSRLVRLNHLEEEFEQTVEDAKIVGHKTLVLAYIHERERKDAAQFSPLARRLERIAEKLSDEQIAFGYHNHRFEFEEVGGHTLFRTLAEEIDPALMHFELDFHHLVRAGVDPIGLIQSHPGRFKQWHIKDLGFDNESVVDVGTGKINFADLFGWRHVAGMKSFYVEDRRTEDPLRIAEQAHHYLASSEFLGAIKQ